MYSKDYSLQSVPEIVAHSGFALLHFYSDIAYNLSGFNISYRYVKCTLETRVFVCNKSLYIITFLYEKILKLNSALKFMY